MRILFTLALLAGLALGVRSMIVGIDREQRRRRIVAYVNWPTVGAFLAAFGATGYLLARFTTLGAGALVALAAAAGALALAGTVALIAGWAVPSAAHDVEDERYRLQGHLGRVVRPMGAGAPGRIAYEHEGVRHECAALGLDDAPIPADAEVVIERIEGGIAYVELWSRIEEQLRLPS